MHVMYISNLPERGEFEKSRMEGLGEAFGEVISVGSDRGFSPDSMLKTPDDEVAEAWEDEGKIVRWNEE